MSLIYLESHLEDPLWSVSFACELTSISHLSLSVGRRCPGRVKLW